jgi:hypothetical protein
MANDSLHTAGRVAVLAAAGRSLSLMWRHVGIAIGLTVVVILPVEWLLGTVGLRGGMPDVSRIRFFLAAVLSLAAGLWATAAFLRVVDGRERGDDTAWPIMLFESLDALPWLCLNMVAVAVAIVAALVMTIGVVSVVAVVTVAPSGLSGLMDSFGSNTTAALLAVFVATAIACAVWIGSLMVRWILVTAVVVLEGRRWGLERSSQLTRGSRWRCFGVVMVVGAVVTTVLGIVGGVALALGGGAGRDVPAAMFGDNLALQVALGFTSLLFSTTYYVLLAALREDAPPTAGSPAVAPPGANESPPAVVREPAVNNVVAAESSPGDGCREEEE